MTKKEFVAAVAQEAEVALPDAEKIVNACLSVVERTLADGGDVRLPGFGTFEVRERAARKGVNPQTKEEIEIPASKSPAFKAGKALKEAVNAD